MKHTTLFVRTRGTVLAPVVLFDGTRLPSAGDVAPVPGLLPRGAPV